MTIEVTVIGEDTAEAERVGWVMEVQVAVCAVIPAPPLNVGGVKLIDACVLPGVAVPMVGASGTVRGVTSVAAEAAPAPAELVAVTVQEYWTPLTNPVATIGDAPALSVRVVCPLATQVDVYKVMAPPPLLAGGVNVIVACPLPGVEATICGAPGATIRLNTAVTVVLPVSETIHAPLPLQPPPDQLAR